MKTIYKRNNKLIYQLFTIWGFIRKKRKLQLLCALVLMNINGILEFLTLTSGIPFIRVLINPQTLLENKYIAFLGISNNQQLFFIIPILFGTLAAIASFIRILNLWINGRLSAAISTDISSQSYKNLLLQDYKFHLNQKSNEIINSLSLDISKFQGLIKTILNLITSLIICIAIFTTMAFINWKLTFSIGFIIGLVYFLILKFCKKTLSNNSKTITRCNDLQFKYIQEGLGAIKDIILNQTHHIYINNYRKNDIPLKVAMVDNKFLTLVPRFAIEGFILFLISLYTLYVLNFTSMDISKNLPILGALILGAQRILPAIQLIYTSLAQIQSTRTSLKRILFFLNLNNHNFEDNIEYFPKFEKNVVFDNVSFEYEKNGENILKEISFTITKGEKIGIIGTTGSGKSTLLDLFMGLSKPSRGFIYVDGIDINDDKNIINLKRWHKSISHVPQKLFFTNSSIAENIAFGEPKGLINFKRVKKVSNLARISEFIESKKFGYKTLIGERGINLSGGQLQRVGIARALYRNPKVLILDEITSALDTKTEKEVLSSIRLLEKGITVLIIAHRKSTLKDCDKVIQLEDGKIKKIFLKSELDSDEFNS